MLRPMTDEAIRPWEELVRDTALLRCSQEHPGLADPRLKVTAPRDRPPCWQCRVWSEDLLKPLAPRPPSPR